MFPQAVSRILLLLHGCLRNGFSLLPSLAQSSLRWQSALWGREIKDRKLAFLQHRPVLWLQGSTRCALSQKCEFSSGEWHFDMVCFWERGAQGFVSFQCRVIKDYSTSNSVRKWALEPLVNLPQITVGCSVQIKLFWTHTFRRAEKFNKYFMIHGVCSTPLCCTASCSYC